MTTMVENLRILRDIVSVKNANIFYDDETNTYHLVHYDTEILVVKDEGLGNYEIVKVLKCSKSSNRAIYQLTDYLGLSREEVKRKMLLHRDFTKYVFHNNIRKTREDLLYVLKR